MKVVVVPLWLSLGLSSGFVTSTRRRSFALQSQKSDDELTVVVVGGGWAGFSAADALAPNKNVQIHLLDASPRGPGGLASGWRTEKLQRPVEAGIHGFWREYRNTFAVLDRLGLDRDEVLTPYTPSVLVSDSGRVALANPMVADDDESTPSVSLGDLNWSNPSRFAEQIASLLPPPLDLALLAEYNPNSPLTVADRVTGLGLLGAWADFGQEDEESWDRYDQISADNLFLNIAKISPRLYAELVVPLLHVLPMTPGYDCSAAAALSCFHVFALQSRGAFDVRWCRGSIGEKIFNPWVEQLAARGNVHVRGSARVSAITKGQTKAYNVALNDNADSIECDAVVLAIGATAAGRLIDSCPPLNAVPNRAPQWKAQRGITCVAARLFLKKSFEVPTAAMSDSPVYVCGPKIIPELPETGFCVYDLTRLQDEFRDDPEIVGMEIDFFRADSIARLDDNAVVEISLRAIAAALDVPALSPSLVLDSSVVRARNAVSHFCVGSAANSPPVKLGRGLYICGDWVDRKGHASWSTEKAVVTGRQAARALSGDFSLRESDTDVISAAPDTPQLKLLRQLSAARKPLSPILPPFPTAPW